MKDIKVETEIRDFMNQKIQDLAKQQARAIDDTVIDFLRKHGYKPRRTEKYAKNLVKKLEKQGLAIKLDEIVLEEKYDGFSYIKRCVYVPSFVEKE